MSGTKSSGFQSQLVKLLFIQLLVISAATLLGVYAATKIFEDVLIKQALKGEAEHYWSLYSKNNQQPLPDTDNLTGFLVAKDDDSSVPQALTTVAEGYGRVDFRGTRPIVYVSDQDGMRLYLIFEEESVRQLATYFGVVPLTVVLLLLYLLAWFSYHHARRVVSPVVKLAEILENYDWNKEKQLHVNLSEIRFASDKEAAILIEALRHFTERLSTFIERERNFTRHASHELRTPLAVIKGSLELLDREGLELSKKDAALKRIRNTTKEMEELIETLLLLAREEDISSVSLPISVNELALRLSEQIRTEVGSSNVGFDLQNNSELEVFAPEKVVSIILSNLIRNAFKFTQDGEVRLIINQDSVEVCDTGVGMTQEESSNVFDMFYRASDNSMPGYGLGLAIVKKLCDRLQWKVSVNSEKGKGTSFIVWFSQAEEK